MKDALIYFLRIAVVTLSLILNGYSLKAQTKEETIAWLAGKINKYGKDVNNKDGAVTTVFLYGGQVININEHSTDGTNQTDHQTDIHNIKITDEHASGTQYCHQTNINNIIGVEKFQSENIRGLTISTNGPKIGCFNCETIKKYDPESHIFIILDWDGEADLYDRFYNALVKLVSYNKQDLPKPPKEAF
jgi:hypothetical protein